MDSVSFTDKLKAEAFRLGFDLVGATPAVVPEREYQRLQRWLADGFAGRMEFFARRLDAYRHPDQLLPGIRGILMLAVNYRTVEPVEPEVNQARVSRCAWGIDYHDAIRRRLRALADYHRRLAPGAGVRGIVDTAPLLERHFARTAGLGWIGKNNLLINRRYGSWLFLAGLLTTEELQYAEPEETDGCGTCRACLDACPAGALVEPHRLDARRCVSYLTIEMRGEIPPGLHSACRGRLFGCDACQEVCPWNRQTPATAEPAFQPAEGMNPVDLAELATLNEEEFRRRFRHSPLYRAGREKILHNAQPTYTTVQE